MPISIDYTEEHLSGQRKSAAAQNLYALLREISGPQQILLNNLGTQFLFHSRNDDSGACDYPNRTIELNVREFSRFKYERRPQPSRNQRWALATLKEEAIHYLAEHLGFDRSREWQRAVATELKNANPLRDQLFAAQRKYDSSSKEIKLSLAEYAADISVRDKIVDFLHGEWEPGEEFLVDLLLVRDYLKATHNSADAIDQKMQAAFPSTYRLALGFESMLEKEAMKHGPIEDQLKALRAAQSQTRKR
jgi:hypothetical protein